MNSASSVNLSEAAFKRRRAQDVLGYFYGALQHALLHGKFFQVTFDDQDEPEPFPPLPDSTMRYSASVNPGGAERLHQPPDDGVSKRIGPTPRSQWKCSIQRCL